jgi:hypothetical protein
MKLALVLLVLLAACDDEDSNSAAAFCVSETNKYREMAGVEPLTRSAELQAFAQEGAEVDFGTAPHEHFGTDGGGIAAAENECPQQDGWVIAAGESEKTVVAQCIRAFYEEGQGGPHYANLMGPYTRLGCGIYKQDDKITIVQDFGE